MTKKLNSLLNLIEEFGEIAKRCKTVLDIKKNLITALSESRDFNDSTPFKDTKEILHQFEKNKDYTALLFFSLQSRHRQLKEDILTIVKSLPSDEDQ